MISLIASTIHPVERFEAAKCFWPQENARPLAEHLGEIARRLLENRATRRAARKKRGSEDIGKFRPPTLRNVAVTAPYMHDGSIATLSEVLDHYAAGGRTSASGPLAWVGHDNPNRAPNVHGFSLTADEKRDVIAFLESLTDSAFLHNPAFSSPWKSPP